MAMTNTQYLLLRLAGEAAEVAQIALKTAEFGLHEVYETRSNLLRCHDELNDLLGVVQKLNAETEFGFVPSQEALDAKCVKIDKYRDYSYRLGMVQKWIFSAEEVEAILNQGRRPDDQTKNSL